MLCEKCGKNIATTHIRTIVNGVLYEKNLCGKCATDEGYSEVKYNSLAEMLSSMFADDVMTNTATQTKHCKCCGSTYSDIAKSGKVGCPQCYETFYNELLPYLKRVHGSTKHIGRSPSVKSSDKVFCGETVESLREKLNTCIKEENYEEAVVIRDKIKELESDK